MFIPWDDMMPVYLITRSKVRGRLIGGSSGGKSIDSQITNYLVERFTPGEINFGKGSKKNPGFFYGFKGDIWQAYALGVAFCDMKTSSLKKDKDYLEKGRVQ